MSYSVTDGLVLLYKNCNLISGVIYLHKNKTTHEGNNVQNKVRLYCKMYICQ